MGQVWGLLKLRSSIPPLWIFLILYNHPLDASYYIHLCHPAPQLSFGEYTSSVFGDPEKLGKLRIGGGNCLSTPAQNWPAIGQRRSYIGPVQFNQ